ncbi:unnamed protein product, partial [Staurois parvus]
WCAVSLRHSRSPINEKSRRCRLGHVISCVQSQLIASVPPVSAYQCQLSVLINATFQLHINATYQCLPVHINATYQCLSELPFSVTYHCQSVPPINASQCHLSVRISASYQRQSVLPISAT